MGSWDRRRLQTMYDHGLLCAFTRQWRKKKYNGMLRARDWYRDCHVLPVEQDGDHIICEVVIMGRITYDCQTPAQDTAASEHASQLLRSFRLNFCVQRVPNRA